MLKEELKKVLNNPRNKGKAYTYVLFRNDLTPFYVGVGKGPRVFRHLEASDSKYNGNRHKANTVKKELKEGQIWFALDMVHSNRDICLERERIAIAHFGRSDLGTGNLTNLTDGGDDAPVGVVVSEETRKLKSEIGLARRDEFAEIARKQWAGYSQEERTVILDRLNATKNSPAALEKIAKATKERWADPEYKQRLSETQKISQKKNAHLQTARMKEKWSDPVFREMMLEKRRLAREAKKALKEETEVSTKNNSN